ncbi:unnamed protein product [Spodoptera exigua]|nr:unnamed protein product [Spodoptera exigua]
MWSNSKYFLRNTSKPYNLEKLNKRQTQQTSNTFGLTSAISHDVELSRIILEKNNQLQEYLTAFGVFESEQETQQRCEGLCTLHQLVRQWQHTEAIEARDRLQFVVDELKQCSDEYETTLNDKALLKQQST